MLLIGSHLRYESEQLYGIIKNTININGNCAMFYSGESISTKRFPITEILNLKAHKLMKENNIKKEHVFLHAPFIINLANNENINKYNYYLNFLKEEMKRCEKYMLKYLILHPGSSVKLSKETALNNVVSALNEVLKDSKVTILLEFMSGKGTELLSNIDEIKYVLDNIKYQNIGICLDTCHMHDAGVNLEKFDVFLEEFDKKIGLEKIKCIHLNDSKNICGSRKDRHENIGYGTIGFETLLNICYNKKLEDIPKILETPIVKTGTKIYSPSIYEIENLRNKKFVDFMK